MMEANPHLADGATKNLFIYYYYFKSINIVRVR